jgi:integrase
VEQLEDQERDETCSHPDDRLDRFPQEAGEANLNEGLPDEIRWPIASPRAWFELVMEEAVKRNPALADVTWHIFRHTYISRLVMAGVDLRTVQELAGHKDIKMTVRYAHLAPAHKLAAVDRLAEYRKEQEAAA